MELAVTLAMAAIFLAGSGILAGIGWLRSFQSDALRDACNQLDYAVRRYGQNHLAVDTSSMRLDSEDILRYRLHHAYPPSQTNLSELHDLGYLLPAVKLKDFQLKAVGADVIQDNSVIFYETNSDNTKYRIEVILPNGKTYVTPGSSSF